MTDPLTFINSTVPDDERPAIWQRGRGVTLAKCTGATGSPGYNPELPGDRMMARGAGPFDIGFNEEWEVLSREERAFFESLQKGWR